MRVIAGKYRSRLLKTIDSLETRPTLDQVKESFFNSIGPSFDGGHICDVFGGSGAIAIEFLSRGCEQATIIEKNKQAYNIIKENVSMVEEPVHLHFGSYETVLKKENQQYDYIYCDPPYRFKDSFMLLELLSEHMNQSSDLYYEADKNENIVVPSSLEVYKEKQYRRTKILYLRLVQ